MYFLPFENTENINSLGIKVYLKNYIKHTSNPRLREAVYTHIEHLVGEKTFANDINFIDLAQLAADTIEPQPIELYFLNDYIRECKKET